MTFLERICPAIALAFFLCVGMAMSMSEARHIAGPSSYKAAAITYALQLPDALNKDNSNYPMEIVQQTWRNNIAGIKPLLAEAEKEKAQIVVTPEGGMTLIDTNNPSTAYNWSAVIPEADQNINMCEDTKISSDPSFYLLNNVACLAKNHSFYLTVSFIDRQPNTKGENVYYNTHVVFDRQGVLVAKYHKMHPYLEPSNTPSTTGAVTFKTDFGVEFGLTVCFDLMFSDPSQEMIELQKKGIKNVLNQMSFVNPLPMVAGVIHGQAYSRFWGVNLVVSGLASRDYEGSGIYTNGQPLTYFIEKRASNHVTVADVPVEPTKFAPHQISTHRDDEHHIHNDALLNNFSLKSWLEKLMKKEFGFALDMKHTFAYPGRSHTIRASLSDLVCEASFKVNKDSPDFLPIYAIVALRGKILALSNVTACGFMKCPTPYLCMLESIKGTGGKWVSESDVLFDSFKVTAYPKNGSVNEMLSFGESYKSGLELFEEEDLVVEQGRIASSSKMTEKSPKGQKLIAANVLLRPYTN